jgi:hypothetical protein
MTRTEKRIKGANSKSAALPPKSDRILEPRYCPICGIEPEYPAVAERTHIFSMRCEKCDVRFAMWLTP